MKLIVFILLSIGFPAVVNAHPAESKSTEHWHTHGTKLPKPVSDHSATLDPSTGKVYLMGGCNNTKGNIRLNDTDMFICPDVTDACHVFDATTGIITQLPNAPRPRYRHAAVLHNGLIWHFGGRNIMDDGIVYNVDVLEISTGTWRTDLAFVLPTEIARSDHTAFVIQDTIYLVGGYELSYNATADTIAIVVPLSLASKTQLVWAKKASLNKERGDCHAAVVTSGDAAYIVGGFTHVDEWCKALDVVERYSPFDDTWEIQDALTHGRADKATVAVGDHIYVIGGESKTDCSRVASQRTTPTTQVEVLDTSDPDAVWTEEIADIPNDHFRFPAVSYNGVIYTFGGQNYYRSECDCFATTANILTFDTTVTYASGSAATMVMAVPTLAISAVFLLALW